MSKKKFWRNAKLQDIIKDNNHQYCKVCHHTLYFNLREEKKHCDYCGTLNKNHTRGHFNYNFYKARQKNEKYKVIKLEEK